MKSEENVKTTAFSQVFLWFGAAVSIAEIQTGALIAPLGLYKGLLSILSGHLIGAFVLYFAGLIGAETGLSSIESTRISFGTYGSCGFSVLNILQLLGWTAIMIVNGASALNVISEKMLAYKSHALWCILIGVFICVWILVGMKNLAKINVVIISALFALSVLLGFIVYRGNLNPLPAGTMAFGEGVELSAAMALSWLPLISDYTRDVKNKTAGTLGSVIGYFAGSTAMFAIGLGGALYAGTSDVAA
ncbi:MAG: cytosine permease, partial [Bacillota bacterium]|nr:cytosine permease [Bacillota bacterium]